MKGVEDEMLVLKSRNTLVISAMVFLIIVILLRLSGGFLADNIERITGAIFAGNADKIPLLDFSSIDFSWLNPANWSVSGIKEAINEWLHDMVDSVLPAVINSVTIAMANVIVVAKTSAMTNALKLGKMSSWFF